MKLLGSLFSLAAVAAAFVLPAMASADPSFERAFGGDVAGGTGFEVCTVITGCSAGSSVGDAGFLPNASDVIRDPHGGILVTEVGGNRISRFLLGPDGTPAFDRTFGYGVQNGEPSAFQNCVADCRSGEDSAEAGGFNEPWKMAFDDQGRLLVADYGTRRVDRFLIASDGTATFDRAFGWDVDPGGPAGLEACTTTCQAGSDSATGAGAIQGPDGIAIDSTGGILVGDYTLNRMSRFTVTDAGVPQFDRAFGLDVVPGGGQGFENCTTATGCKAGLASGGGAGAVRENYDVTVGPDGLVYSADHATNRVNVFARTAGGAYEFRHAFGEDVIPGGSSGFETCTAATGCQAGATTGAAGSLWKPSGLAFDPSRGLYVTSQSQYRISRFKPDGDSYAFDYVYGLGVGGGSTPQTCVSNCSIGISSADAGGFGSAEGLSFVSGRELYVADYLTNRVDVIEVDPVVTVTNVNVPGVDPGRFDLKVGAEIVRAGAGNGESGSARFTAGSAVTISENAASGTNPALYDTVIDCGTGAAEGTSLTVQNVTSDLACTITNTQKGPGPTPAPNFTKLVLQPKKKKVKAGKKVKLTVKVTNTGQRQGTATVQLKSSAKKKASAPKRIKVTVPAGKTVSKKFTVKTKKRKRGKVKITAKLGKRTAKTVLTLRR